MKGVDIMITFIILLCTLLLVTVASIALLSVGGAAFIVVFGDLIVCALMIVWIMKRLLKKKTKK